MAYSDPELEKECQRKYRADHKEELCEYGKRWRAARRARRQATREAAKSTKENSK